MSRLLENDPESLPECPNPFGGIVRDYVESVSDSQGMSRDLAVGLVLPVIATCLGGRVEVHRLHAVNSEGKPISRNPYPLNLYTLGIGEVSSGKSQVYKSLVNPLADVQRSLRETAQVNVAEYSAKLKIANKALSEAEKSGNQRELTEAELEVMHLKAAPVEPPMLFHSPNTSPEKAITMMHKQGGRMSFLTSEGTDLSKSLDSHYRNKSGGYSTEYIRQAYDCEAISYARRTEDTQIEVPYPSLQIGALIQPKEVKPLLSSGIATGESFRFLYFNLPLSLGVEGSIPEDLRQKYTLFLSDLARKYFRAGSPERTMHAMHDSREASAEIDRLRLRMKERAYRDLVAGAAMTPALLGKYESQLVRVSAIIALTHERTEIALSDVKAADRLIRYCHRVFRRVWELDGHDPGEAVGRQILRWLSDNSDTLAEKTRIETSDVRRSSWRKRSHDDKAIGLRWLQSAGYVIAHSVERNNLWIIPQWDKIRTPT